MYIYLYIDMDVYINTLNLRFYFKWIFFFLDLGFLFHLKCSAFHSQYFIQCTYVNFLMLFHLWGFSCYLFFDKGLFSSIVWLSWYYIMWYFSKCFFNKLFILKIFYFSSTKNWMILSPQNLYAETIPLMWWHLVEPLGDA